jgi:hypothetical protein
MPLQLQQHPHAPSEQRFYASTFWRSRCPPDIFESSFQHVRQQMVNDVTTSTRWTSERFINAADVTVSSRDHFLAALEGWKKLLGYSSTVIWV